MPVAAGAARPIVREPWVPVEVHGLSGLDGADLPEPAVGAVRISALELTSALLREADEPVTLVATGPLTNVALLLRAAPGLRDRIAAIWLMGGSLGEGNTTAAAEFNIWADPEAAAIVFESGIPIRMAGLDVTHQALVLPGGHRPARGARDAARTGLRRPDAVLRRSTIATAMAGTGRRSTTRSRWRGWPSRGSSTRRTLRIDIETAGVHTRGRTVADREGLTGRPVNATVGLRVDRERLIDLVVDAVGSFG